MRLSGAKLHKQLVESREYGALQESFSDLRWQGTPGEVFRAFAARMRGIAMPERPDLIELGGLCQISPAYVIRVFVINQERVPRQKIQRHCQRHTLATVNGGVCNRPRRVSPARTGRTGITGQCQLTQWQPG